MSRSRRAGLAPYAVVGFRINWREEGDGVRAATLGVPEVCHVVASLYNGDYEPGDSAAWIDERGATHPLPEPLHSYVLDLAREHVRLQQPDQETP